MKPLNLEEMAQKEALRWWGKKIPSEISKLENLFLEFGRQVEREIKPIFEEEIRDEFQDILLKYGGHLSDCAGLADREEEYDIPCTCGYREAYLNLLLAPEGVDHGPK